jgi:Helix-turn-helix domain
VSIQAIAYVFDHSRAEGVDRLVLLALANHANAETGECHPGYRRIADEANCSTATVGRAVARLAELGELLIERRGIGRATTRYRLPWLVRSVSPGRDTTAGVASHADPVASHLRPVASRLGETKPEPVNRTSRAPAREAAGGALNPTDDAADVAAVDRADAAHALQGDEATAAAELIRAQLPARHRRSVSPKRDAT